MKNKTKSHPLRWHLYKEGRDLIHEAVGGSTDGESNDLFYRIRESHHKLGSIFWENSSPELKVGAGWRIWRTLKGAKGSMQQYHEGAFK